MTRSGRIWMVVGVLVLFVLVVGAVGVPPVRSRVDAASESVAVQSVVAESIGYQGYLTDDAGNPLSGTYTMRFALYRVSSGGAPVFESGNMSVVVSEGLFDVGVNVPQEVFDGGPLWLAITVDGEVLSPRQEIQPAPYAMSLRPGATVRQVATGTAVRVESDRGIGLHGAGQVYGLYGTNTGTTQGSGYGGYFESSTGIGVYGESTASPVANNQYAPGVSGYSEHGVGVYGSSASRWGTGIFGEAATGFGTFGTSDGIGIGGVGHVYGVYGRSSSTAPGSGYGGYFESTTGIGVYGESKAKPSANNLYAPGIYGYSESGAGIMGASGPAGVAGFFDGNLIVDGDLIVTGSKGGYVVDIGRNDGAESLVQGDLVVVTGVADPVVGDIPVPLVRRADAKASTAVIGVVDATYRVQKDGRGHMVEGAADAGDYVSIVTMGAFTALRVDAAYGAIVPGDLLVSSPTPGHAMRAENPAVGTVIGKALDGLEMDRGTIPVMVTLQ